jgi:hypothetical protein
LLPKTRTPLTGSQTTAKLSRFHTAACGHSYLQAVRGCLFTRRAIADALRANVLVSTIRG